MFSFIMSISWKVILKISIYILGSILLLLLFLAFLYFVFLRNYIFRLPLKRKGFKNAPAYPFNMRRTVRALFNLIRRAKAVQQAKYGLSGTKYNIGEYTGTAYAFCYAKNNHTLKEHAYADLIKQLQYNPFIFFGIGASSQQSRDYASERRIRNYGTNSDSNNIIPDPKTQPPNPNKKDKESDEKASKTVDLTIVSLDDPEKFDMSWTTYGNVKEKASAKLKGEWVKSLTDPEEATKQFFPTISNYGIAYNLLILQKVTTDNIDRFKKGALKEVWTKEMDDLCQAKKLYIIDLRIFNVLKPQMTNKEHEIWSYTPATFTWLKQDENKDLSPFAVYVEGYEDKKENIGTAAQFYNYAEHQQTTWIYALQAAKVSITVFGIWLGHVYPWHLVTAAMSMTLYNYVDKKSFLYQLLGQKCNYLIGFNDALYLQWGNAAPPTSINTTAQFLQVVDKYAIGRGFFDDDPITILAAHGISEEDFTDIKPWDKYPLVRDLLKIWARVETYAERFVDICYQEKDGKSPDRLVQEDKNLQKWIQQSIKKGNIQGLSKIESAKALKQFLTSFIYRFTVHGLSRLDNTANPAMTFIPNFPPTLHIKDNPDPSTKIDTKALLEYLPKTGTIGKMMDFYFTFADSAPYESLIPVDGIDQHLHFFNTGDNKSKKEEDLNHSGKDRDSGKAQELNTALINFRRNMRLFMDEYNEENKIEGFEADPVQHNQWPLGVET